MSFKHPTKNLSRKKSNSAISLKSQTESAKKPEPKGASRTRSQPGTTRVQVVIQNNENQSQPEKSSSAGAKWEEDETTFFISCLTHYNEALEGMKEKKPIWEKIAAELYEENKKWKRDSKQVSKKIHNLKQEYKLKRPKTTGDEAPKWVHFEALHKLWHNRPALNSDAAKTSEFGFEEITLDLDLPEDGNGTSATSDAFSEEENSILAQGQDTEFSQDENTPKDSQSGTKEHQVILSRTSDSVETPRKKPRMAEQALKLSLETLEFMKEQSVNRKEERDAVKATNNALVEVLKSIADSLKTEKNPNA